MKKIKLPFLLIMLFLISACGGARFDYDDGNKQEEQISNQEETLKVEYTIGQTLCLGQYEQDNNLSNGKEDIEWIILDKKEDEYLLISKCAIECLPFNYQKEYTNWDTCSLRIWLNEDFYNSAFNSEEQSKILVSTIKAEPNDKYNLYQGSDTDDKVFLLSMKEAKIYFKDDIERLCNGTNRSISNGLYINANGNCWWWLRTKGAEDEAIVSVFHEGSIYEYGTYANFNKFGVRPCIWIKIY